MSRCSLKVPLPDSLQPSWHPAAARIERDDVGSRIANQRACPLGQLQFVPAASWERPRFVALACYSEVSLKGSSFVVGFCEQRASNVLAGSMSPSQKATL
jgi:hypothetical protein